MGRRIKDEFFEVDYDFVKTLVGKCFADRGKHRLIKILGVRDDTDNPYWESCRYWEEFIYEEVDKHRDGTYSFDDYHWLQEDYNDDLAKFRLTPQADMNIAAEEMFHIGKDGCLYVDYCCDRTYYKFKEVKPEVFEKAREEAINRTKLR